VGAASSHEVDQCTREGGITRVLPGFVKHAIPSYMLLHWSMNLYRSAVPRIGELEKAYWNVRRCQDDVVEMLEMPMPFQYFHIMNLMLLLNLTLWAFSFGLMDSFMATPIFLFVQLVFQGIRELSISLADPYGCDEADFPLSEWMNSLYTRVVCIVEDPFVVEIDPVGSEPMQQLQNGCKVVDMLICEDDFDDDKFIPIQKSTDGYRRLSWVRQTNEDGYMPVPTVAPDENRKRPIASYDDEDQSDEENGNMDSP